MTAYWQATYREAQSVRESPGDSRPLQVKLDIGEIYLWVTHMQKCQDGNRYQLHDPEQTTN